MPEPDVLDTSALINWPLDALENGFVVESQRLEVNRIAPNRMLSIEAVRMNWVSPSRDSLNEATRIAMKSGDLDGLSETDLHLFALSIELGGHMHTDDYRLQNLCSSIGLNWSSVESRGISEIWEWEVKCRGCGLVVVGSRKTRPASEGIGECTQCGSELRVVRKR
jgi:UPF0271 protein